MASSKFVRVCTSIAVATSVATVPALARAQAEDSDAAAAPTSAPANVSNLVAEPQIAPARRVAASGFFAEGGLGAVAFLPRTSRSAAIGPALSLRLGYDLWSWLSIGIFVAASSHEATVPPPPVGEWFQLYRGGADGRLGFRLERIAAFVEGGAGIAMVSSNVLEKAKILDPGEKYSLAFHAGGGLEYQLENRHYAVGIGINGLLVPMFTAPSGTMKAIDSRLYLRYTYGG